MISPIVASCNGIEINAGRRSTGQGPPNLHGCHCKLCFFLQAVTDVCNLPADDLMSAVPVAVKVSAELHFFASESFQHPRRGMSIYHELSSVHGYIQRHTDSFHSHFAPFELRIPPSPFLMRQLGVAPQASMTLSTEFHRIMM